jgi:glycosyltransferase involved in cell wall biosynthesis
MTRVVEGVLDCAPQHEYVLIMAPGTEHLIANRETANVTIITTTVHYYSVQEQFVLWNITKRSKLDLLHSPHFLIPLYSACPTLATIHDVIHLACKEDLESWLARIYSSFMIKAAAKRASRVLTVSEFSKSDIVRFLDIPADKIDVSLLGVESKFMPSIDHERQRAVAAKYGATKPFILYTGIFKGRKNHLGLLRAFAKVRDAGLDIQLVIAGPLGKGKTVLEERARELGILDCVSLPGFVAEDDLPTLYSAARVYACPSTYEGFGFTILEAMSCGTPVVCNPMTSLTEVGGDAPIWADSLNPDEFGQALIKACIDESVRAAAIERGYLNAKKFRWENTVRKTLEVYNAVFESGMRS